MATFTKQVALLGETAAMAFDTLRSNKMRSALTVLGVVIGVTSIVGMTSLIRGFDTSLRNSINSLGPNTIFVQRFGGLSFSSGASFMELMRRPLTHHRRHATRSSGWPPPVGMVDIWIGGGGPGSRRRADVLPGRADPAGADHGHHREVRGDQLRQDARRAMFTEQEVRARPQRGRHRLRPVRGAVRATRPRPDRQADPRRRHRIHGARRDRQAAVAGRRISLGVDDFAIIPYTAFRKQFGSEKVRRGPFGGIRAMIAVLPHEGRTRDEAMREVEAIMRIRHGLTLDKPNDFDLVTRTRSSRSGSRFPPRSCCRWS